MIRTIGVIGAGTMGAGIAVLAATAGLDVHLNDLNDEVLRSARSRITSDITKGVEKGKFTRPEADRALERIGFQSSLPSVAAADLIIEAVVEDLGVKQEIFRQLGALTSPATILASNTSSLSITAIASGIPHPERIVGMHFFNPPHVMKLVEVIGGLATSPTTLESTLGLARALGKTPVLVKDRPGFIVNRVARPFYGEALRLLGEGVAPAEEIDRIVKLEGGFRMGPFELMDLIGIDVNYAVTQSMYDQTYGEARYRPHVIQKRMVDAGYLGRKTKRGFYTYPG